MADDNGMKRKIKKILDKLGTGVMCYRDAVLWLRDLHELDEWENTRQRLLREKLKIYEKQRELDSKILKEGNSTK